MANLPITHMTLYKHGVGFFERRAEVLGEEVQLSFRVSEMNDILKSLTAIDWGGEGQVLGVDYATPQSCEERLAGCSIRLSDARSLRDLLVGLRGRRVMLSLNQGETLRGKLVGLDTPSERQPMESALVSVLLDDGDEAASDGTVTGACARVQTVALERVQGVEILDERGAADLRFFLQTSLSQEEYREVTIRLTPGEHDLSVSYIAPAPTWRVSYRLVLDPDAEGGPRSLLLGWGIFDNRLEEDLQGISLSLVAGMPISFVYDLYTPFTPERPEVKEEARVAAAPVEFEGRARAAAMGAISDNVEGMASFGIHPSAAPMAPPAKAEISLAEMEAAQMVQTQGEALGELFQYVIQTPVTVGRGQSAMVPVVSARLEYQKDLLYNGSKMPAHPVATVRMKNESGLTLERGPVTVLDEGEYVGEAVLPFTVSDAEIVVPYSVELGAEVYEDNGSTRESHAISVRGAYFHFEEWRIRWRTYRVSNKTANPLTVLVEHPRASAFELFNTPEPDERTDEYVRFAVDVPAGGERVLKVNERRLVSRREQVRQQSHRSLRKYLDQGLMNRQTYDQVVHLLTLYDRLDHYEKELREQDAERAKIYEAQKQIQGNMGALSQTGKEGALRARYVDQLEATEQRLRDLEEREAELKTAITQVREEIETFLKSL